MSVLRPIFFDLETTGIRPDKDRIIEIAAIDLYHEKSFQSLINPEIPIPPDAEKIHGITNDMVQTAEIFSKVAKKFFDFCAGSVILIAHNGEAFDIPFFAAECTRNQLSLPMNWAFVDSLKWARKYRKDLPRHSLQYLRQVFGIAENRAHRALDDVQVLSQVFSLMVDDLNYEEIIQRIDGYTDLSSFQKKNNSQKVATENSPLFSLF